jgi:hypothetical protein
MTQEEARTHLRNAIRSECLWLTVHCQERMAERQVSVEDINNVLLWGVVGVPEKSPKYNNFKCEVTGADLDGVGLIVRVAINPADYSARVITVY